MAAREGKYRINRVSELTGVPSATLRAWERRYGLPDPGRTDSAYRLYSDHDIAMIQRVRELTTEGMAPSEAAKAVLQEAQTWTDAAANGSDPYDRVREAIVHAVDAFDPKQTENAVRHAMALGSASAAYDRVFAPAMREIGQRWHEGKISIGQEHMATQILGDAVTALLSLVERDDAQRTVVVACFADEDHTFASNGVALHMASWGYRVVRLGAKTPPSAIRHAVDELQPSLVVLSVTMAPPPHRARELVDDYAEACAQTPWAVGGMAAARLRELVEARGGLVAVDYEPSRLKSTLEGLIVRRRSTPTGKPPRHKEAPQ